MIQYHHIAWLYSVCMLNALAPCFPDKPTRRTLESDLSPIWDKIALRVVQE